jgi:hypothetical protein
MLAASIDLSNLKADDLTKIHNDILRRIAEQTIQRAGDAAMYDSHSSSHSKNSPIAASVAVRSV